MYFYLFYKVYKFSEASPSRWLSDWKASLTIDVLEIFILISLVYYFDISSNYNSLLYIIYFFGICLPNYCFFHYKNQWRIYVKKFDKYSKRKNRIGGLIVWCLIFIIILNWLFSIYFMDLRARKNMTGPYSKEFTNRKGVPPLPRGVP